VEKFLPYISTRAKITPALFLNNAGIVGSAVYASQKIE